MKKGASCVSRESDNRVASCSDVHLRTSEVSPDNLHVLWAFRENSGRVHTAGVNLPPPPCEQVRGFSACLAMSSEGLVLERKASSVKQVQTIRQDPRRAGSRFFPLRVRHRGCRAGTRWSAPSAHVVSAVFSLFSHASHKLPWSGRLCFVFVVSVSMSGWRGSLYRGTYNCNWRKQMDVCVSFHTAFQLLRCLLLFTP